MSNPHPPKERQHFWFRQYFGFWDHPKWEVVARHAQVPTLVAGAIANKLCECAGKGRTKGSLDKWSAAECAASLKLWQLEMDARDVDRVYAALEAFGWIDQGFIPEWYERQPDDPTAAERQTLWRAKRDRERDRKRDQRDRHAANQRAYRLRKKANGLGHAGRVTGDVTQEKRSKKERADVTALATGETVTWKQVQEAGYVPARQRVLPLPPVPLNQRGNR